MTHEEALTLLKEYNKDPFHLRHGLTVEGVMGWYAENLGYEAEVDFWKNVGLLHDIDFELYPEEHCLRAPEMLRKAGCDERLIHAVVSHGYGIDEAIEAKPEHEMEKVLYAADELTGLIWAAALMRPSRSVQDMEVKSVKKKFKAVNFAAGCSREVIQRGADQLGWELGELIDKTLQAMKSCEAAVEKEVEELEA